VNSLSNYNSVFELFAAISSALVGIQEFRLFIIQSLRLITKSYLIKVNNTCSICNEKIKNVNSAFEIYKDTLPDSSLELFNALYVDLCHDADTASQLRRKLSVKRENNIINKISIACFIHSFLYCVCFLIISALTTDKFISLNTANLFLANLNILMIVSYGVLILLIHTRPKFPIGKTFITFGIVFSVAIANTKGFHIGASINNGYVVASCLSLCVLPVFLIIAKSILWMLYRLLGMNKKLQTLDNSPTGNLILAHLFNCKRPESSAPVNTSSS